MRGEILVCERLNVPGAWQFPQGGIDAGESPEEALRRELWEEIGVPPTHYTISQCRGPYRYLFGGGRKKKGCHGKEQLYFLCEFTGDATGINVATEHPEFRGYQWILPSNFRMAWLPEMKRDVYRSVLADFFQVKFEEERHESC